MHHVWTRKAGAFLGVVALAGVAFSGAAAARQQAQPAPQEGGKLKVTVEYKGAGTVDASHEVTVWIFDTPNINESSMPVTTDVVTENGGSVSFANLPAEVYIACAFDEKGTYDGSSGPPPSGTPIHIHGSNGVAAPVKSGGADATVTVTFDDSFRMP